MNQIVSAGRDPSAEDRLASLLGNAQSESSSFGDFKDKFRWSLDRVCKLEPLSLLKKLYAFTSDPAWQQRLRSDLHDRYQIYFTGEFEQYAENSLKDFVNSIPLSLAKAIIEHSTESLLSAVKVALREKDEAKLKVVVAEAELAATKLLEEFAFFLNEGQTRLTLEDFACHRS